MESDSTESLNLHDVTNIIDLKHLLKNGQDVNSRNEYDEIPLHSAIRQGRNYDLISEMIKCGADVSAEDLWLVTPLYIAVTKQTKQLKLIQLLLENGGDIGKRNEMLDRGLDQALRRSPSCAKLLVKYKFLKKAQQIQRIYQKEEGEQNVFGALCKIVDLNIKPDYFELFLSDYLFACANEICNMYSILIDHNLTLLNFVADKNLAKALIESEPYAMTNKICHSLKYQCLFIYNDLLARRMSRKALLNCLEKCPIYMPVFKNHTNTYLFINRYAVLSIAEQLADTDLMNLLAVYL